MRAAYRTSPVAAGRSGTVHSMLKRMPIDSADSEGSLADAQALAIDERVQLAFRLWDDGCRSYADVHGVSMDEAAARLSATRQIGRIPLFVELSRTP